MKTRGWFDAWPGLRRAFIAAALLGSVAAHAEDSLALKVDVVGGILRTTLPDGTVRKGAELVGAVLVVALGGRTMRVRIAAVEYDAGDPRGEIILYDFRLVTAAGEEPLCMPDPDGRRLGLPLAGHSDPAGMLSGGDVNDFELVCTSGAQAKCVRFGYAPWRRAPDGRLMSDWYNACVRMLRGDYCGDGRPYTRDGTIVDVYDHIGVQRPDNDPSMRFEGAWGPQGAVCVAHPRIPDIVSLEGLARACPRLLGRLGPEVCSESNNEGLVFNRSR